MATEISTMSEWLELTCKTNGVSWRAASLGAGLNPNIVQEIIRKPSKQPNRETCRKLALYFGVPVDYVLRLAGHTPEGNKPSSARLDRLLETIKGLAPGKLAELALLVNRFRHDDETYLLDGVLFLREESGETTEMFGMRMLDKRFYIADLDVPALIPQAQIENPATFLSFWALDSLYQAYVKNEDHAIRDQIEDWFRLRQRLGHHMNALKTPLTPEQLRRNILAEIQRIVIDRNAKVVDFEIDPALQKYVSDELKAAWVADMNTPIYPPGIPPESALAQAIQNHRSQIPPLGWAIMGGSPIFGHELHPQELADLLTAQANTEDAFAELMYFHPSWPLPEKHQPPSAYAAMLERTANERLEMLREDRKERGEKKM